MSNNDNNASPFAFEIKYGYITQGQAVALLLLLGNFEGLEIQAQTRTQIPNLVATPDDLDGVYRWAKTMQAAANQLSGRAGVEASSGSGSGTRPVAAKGPGGLMDMDYLAMDVAQTLKPGLSYQVDWDGRVFTLTTFIQNEGGTGNVKELTEHQYTVADQLYRFSCNKEADYNTFVGLGLPV